MISGHFKSTSRPVNGKVGRLCREQFLDRPNVIGESKGHCGRHLNSGMHPAEIEMGREQARLAHKELEVG